MSNRLRKSSPLYLIGAILLLGLIYSLLTRSPKVNRPAVPPPSPALAHLGEFPNWPDLAKYDGVLTRAEFEAALQDVYILGSKWPCTISDQSVTVHSKLQPEGQVIKFATDDSRQNPPRYWRPVSELPAAPSDKPLQGMRIAIDPGHLGGKWARMEERWYKRGDTAVTEGDMTLRTAKLLAPRLEALGATIALTRTETEPVTANRPEDFRNFARTIRQGRSEQEVLSKAESLFYRTSEIRARAKLINETIKPDITLCLHYNATDWGEPGSPKMSSSNHFHMILHGAYMASEITHEDERFEMMHKVFQRVHEEEAPLAAELAKSFLKETELPAYIYLVGKPTKQIGPALWARNLLANRLYQCPVLFFEPYVMNNEVVYARVQAGDYEGEKNVAGKMRKSIYREYVDAVVQGLINYYTPRRTSTP